MDQGEQFPSLASLRSQASEMEISAPGSIALTGGALSMVVLESMDRGMVGGNGIVVRLL